MAADYERLVKENKNRVLKELELVRAIYLSSNLMVEDLE